MTQEKANLVNGSVVGFFELFPALTARNSVCVVWSCDQASLFCWPFHILVNRSWFVLGFMCFVGDSNIRCSNGWRKEKRRRVWVCFRKIVPCVCLTKVTSTSHLEVSSRVSTSWWKVVRLYPPVCRAAPWFLSSCLFLCHMYLNVFFLVFKGFKVV